MRIDFRETCQVYLLQNQQSLPLRKALRKYYISMKLYKVTLKCGTSFGLNFCRL